MKILSQFLKFSCMTLLCGILLLAWTSDEPEAKAEPEPEYQLIMKDILIDHGILVLIPTLKFPWLKSGSLSV
jgi:hypothetical protein